jgi:hypothetical protein
VKQPRFSKNCGAMKEEKNIRSNIIFRGIGFGIQLKECSDSLKGE